MSDTSLHFKTALLPEGWVDDVRVVIDAGVIVRIERGVAAGAGEARFGAAIPGLANVHSHGFQRGMAGLTEYRGPDADNFWSWRELMYRFVARMTPEDLEAITAQAYIEMLEGGFTQVGEFHYVHHDAAGVAYTNLGEMAERVGAAASAAGIGLTLMPVFYAHGGFDGAPPTPGQRRFVNDLDGFARVLEACCGVVGTLEHANVGVAPHSLRAVTPGELREVLALAPSGPVHIHAAEQEKEVADCVAWSGLRPVEWLLGNVSVDSRWCLVHATHMTDGEVAMLAVSGAVVGLCPITEANLGDGIASAAGFVNARGIIAIGTDSNVQVNAAAELRQLEYSQRLRDRARNVIESASSRSTGRALFECASSGGARALGREGGALVEGALADIVELNLDSPLFAGRSGDALLDSHIFAGAPDAISRVWRAGRNVVVGGRHIAREDIARRYRAALTRVLA
jgi:formimidoylglutamate deiminase